MNPSDELELLRALGDHLRDAVLTSRDIDMSAIVDKTPADTIYGIDKVTDEALVDWFSAHWTDVEVVSEGLHEPLVLGEPRRTVIVDPVDGTRGLMYDKRAAWALAAVAPHGGTLRDITAAVMTELPTTKQTLCDQVFGIRGGEARASRTDLNSGRSTEIDLQPSRATDLEHGFAQFAKFFPPGKVALARMETDLFGRLGASVVFDDEYIASGGQIYELLTGKDRFVADLRPLVDPGAMASHPYDLCTAMLLEAAGGVVTDPWGAPLDCPLDTTTPVVWVGYANVALAEQIGPLLADVVNDHIGRPR